MPGLLKSHGKLGITPFLVPCSSQPRPALPMPWDAWRSCEHPTAAGHPPHGHQVPAEPAAGLAAVAEPFLFRLRACSGSGLCRRSPSFKLAVPRRPVLAGCGAMGRCGFGESCWGGELGADLPIPRQMPGLEQQSRAGSRVDTRLCAPAQGLGVSPWLWAPPWVGRGPDTGSVQPPSTAMLPLCGTFPVLAWATPSIQPPVSPPRPTLCWVWG